MTSDNDKSWTVMERNAIIKRAVLVFIWRKKGKNVKTVIEKPLSERLCLEAPKESESTDNANREDEGENF